MRRALRLLLMLGTLLYLVSRSLAGSPDPFEVFGLVRFDSGIRAPGFTLPDLNGNQVSVASPAGSAAIVVFWTTWCPHCRREFPSLETLWKAKRDQGFRVIGVNLSEPEDRVAAYVADMKITFPIVIDTSGEVARTYGVHFTPTHFLVERSGRVRAGGLGRKDWSSPQAHALVQVLLDASAPNTSKPARPDRADFPPTRRMERR